jgi:SAM-dependent methyltransferase
MIGSAQIRHGFREPLTGSDIAAAYELYFGSGLYDRRYPAPNPNTLGRIVRELDRRGSRVLDFGCGSGRYATPLAQRPGTTVLAYDVCTTALSELQRQHGDLIAAGRIVPIGTDLVALEACVREQGSVDVALLAFGVLGHIPGRAARQQTLARLLRMVRPGGAIVLGVPNASRRFRAEQRAGTGQEPGDVEYVRESDAGPVPLFYHVYRRAELVADLEAAGFRTLELGVESVLPERAVISSSWLAALDRGLHAVTPQGLVYGFLAVAERPAS